ncbi:hypothetical protein MNBD_ALPHA12-1875 [hydrothermal vent metagenome]|uniref:Collagen triple helix repeat domain protein n=1 Tax=hydrothermal vent metagenome TaxID=652676 RepID=A0A3B0U7K9_9ZZZZ
MFNTTGKTRKFVAGALLSVLLGSTSALAAPFVFIPVGNGGEIEVVDVELGKIVDIYKGLKAIHGLAGTPDGKYLIAGSFSQQEKAAPAWSEADGPMKDGETMDANAMGNNNAMAGNNNNTMGNADNMGNANSMGGDNNNANKDAMDKSMAANMGAANGKNMVSTVTILRKDNGKVVQTVDVPGAVHHVTVSPDGRFAALTQPRNGTVSVIDLKTYEVVTTLKTGKMPNYMFFSADSSTLYVSNAGSNNVSVIDTKDWKITGNIATGTSPEHMILSKDGTTLFVNNNDDGTVSAIDVATNKIVKTYNVGISGKRLHGLDITSDGKALLVAERDSNLLARVDLDSGKVTKQDIGPSPYHVTTIPGTGLAYVSSADKFVMRVVRQKDLSLVNVIKIDNIGHQMVVSQTR